MKKILTIGRNPECDICIPDSTDVVSREHAVLEIGRCGKYFLIDKSRNGTYVNGIRMTTNEKIPVTRKDVVSFAHMRELDWSLVPKDRSILKWSLWSLGAVALIAVLFAVVHVGGDPNSGKFGIHFFRSGADVIDPPVVVLEEVPVKESEPESREKDSVEVESPVKRSPKAEKPRKEEPNKRPVVDPIY